MKEIPSSVANNDIESSMKENSIIIAFYKCTYKVSMHILLWNLGLESGIFVKKTWDFEVRTEI